MAVYFFQAIGVDAVKIGHATNVSRRLRDIRGCSPVPLKLLRTIDGNHSQETWLHKHFGDLRIHGEWFRFSKEMLTIVPPIMNLEPLLRAKVNLKAAIGPDGIRNLASNLGISRQAIHNWPKVPATRVLEIERITGVWRGRLRPDLYPPDLFPEPAAA